MRGRRSMGGRLLRMGMVGLSQAALALPIRSAGAHSSSGNDPFKVPEQLCTDADGSFTVIDGLHYTCDGEDLDKGLVKAARAYCIHAFFTGGNFKKDTIPGGTIVFYDCVINGL